METSSIGNAQESRKVESRGNYLRRYDLGVQHPYLDLIRRHYNLIDDAQWWSRDAIRDFQFQCLRNLVLHASKTVPFYRKLYGGAVEIKDYDDFTRLPMVPRKAYSEGTDQELTTERRAPFTRINHYAKTSGSTGHVVKVARTEELEAWRAACMLREYDWHDIDPAKVGARMRLPVPKTSKGWCEEYGAQMVPAWDGLCFGPLIGQRSGPNFDVAAPFAKVIAALRTLDVRYLEGPPTYFEFMMEFDPSCRAEVILAVGEMLYAPVKEKLCNGFGCRVMDIYATVEGNRLACSCPESGLMHTHDENAVVEILDDDDRPLAGGSVGRVVMTSLHNYATPFIRYELNDVGEWLEGPCACGRSLGTLNQLHGRSITQVKLVGGMRKVASSLVIDMHRVKGVKEFQIRQKDYEKFEVNVVGRENFSDDERQFIRGRIEQLIERGAAVSFCFVDRVERLPSGKVIKVVVDF